MKIALWKEKPWPEAEQELRLIGSNLIDLYYGILSVNEICIQMIEVAEQHGLTSSARLAEWLQPLEYRRIQLSDSSLWVIRQGQNEKRFLHIHPAKYSPFTIRVKAPTLKTVVAMQIFNINLNKSDVSEVNRIRTQKLNLSPIKALAEGKGIARLMKNFTNL